MAGPGSVDRRRRSFVVAAAACSVLPSSVAARAARIQLWAIAGADVERHAEALRTIRARFGDVPLYAPGITPAPGVRPTAYVALGPGGLQSAVEARVDAPVVSLFASRQGYERVSTSAAPARSFTAIYGEPDPAQQMRLIASIFRRAVSVGVLLSDATSHLEPILREAAQAHGLRLDAVRVGRDGKITRSLNLLDRPTVLLIQPDSSLYTAATLRELLESTYRRRLPVIGFSAGLVAAGTLASAYSSVADVLAQLDEVVEQIAARRLPPPRYPAYWRVAVNDSVARSLDVAVDASTRVMGERP